MAGDGSAQGWVPAACTLPTVEQPLRIAEFDEFFRTRVQSWARPRTTELELTISLRVEASARDLAERETDCCSFFRFRFDPAGDGVVVMRIAVPDSRVDVLDAIQARVSSLADAGAGVGRANGRV
jgi:hypothetical protein